MFFLSRTRQRKAKIVSSACSNSRSLVDKFWSENIQRCSDNNLHCMREGIVLMAAPLFYKHGDLRRFKDFDC